MGDRPLHQRRAVRWAALVVTVPTLIVTAAAMPVSAGPPAPSGRVTLPGTAPKWVAQQRATAEVSSAAPVDVRVFLAPRGGQAALDAAVADVSTPGSPDYQHFLTPEQFRARFAPTDAALSSVTSWLSASGLRVTGVEGSRRYVTAHGSSAAAAKAFAVRLHSYQRNGRVVQAPSSEASVPTNVAGVVSGVTGLDTEPHLMQPNARPAAPPSTGFITGRPCSGYYGQLAGTYKADHQTRLPQFKGKTPPYAVCGYTPAQFRSIYGATASKLTGAGQTIGVVDAYASPTVLKDANTYSQRHGDPAFQAGRFTQSNAGTYRFGGADLCDERGWYGEETLDVEAAHGMAPAAGVRYYGAASCLDADLYDAQARVVDENRVAVVSDSFGSPDEDESAGALVQGSLLYQQAAMQGISVLFSSGDDGDEVAASRSQSRQTTSPASNPYVTAVGGTSTAIGAPRNLVFQTGWGTHTYALSGNGGSWIGGVFLYGAGGGESALYSRPSYQSGVVPASVGSGRAVPDVAMDGDPTTGMLIGQTQTFGRRVAYGEYRIGGTSLASPLMAGMVALAGQHSGKRVGFLNPTIYGQVKGGRGTFTDVKAVHVGDGNIRADFTNTEAGTGPIVYSVRTFGQDSSLSLGTGWDETTGLGTPNAKFLTSIN